MPSNLETRLLRLELLATAQAQQIQGILGQLAQLSQQLAAAMSWGAGASGSAGAFYVAFPSAAVSGATWTSGVPTSATSFTGHVYHVSGTGTVTDMGSQTILNWLPATLSASKAVIVDPDGAGNFVVTGQSCT